jgi:acyl-CoA thioester hydrolase
MSDPSVSIMVEKPDFIWPVRIYYEDTDAGGVVYHTNYIKFMERARTEYLRSMGYTLVQLEKEQGILFAVRALSVEYLGPAHLNDLLSITVGIQTIRSASIIFRQTVRRENQILCNGQVRVASISADAFKPKILPRNIRMQLMGESGNPAPC